jgi:acetylornithine deacetylase/succinyl-diaminopimelate desuccinylase-like protein
MYNIHSVEEKVDIQSIYRMEKILAGILEEL